MKYCILLACSLILLVSCTPDSKKLKSDSQSDPWHIIGMGGGGTTQKVLISPHDPEIMLAESDMSGGYITCNGGASWRMFNLLNGVSAFAFDPVDIDIMYAGNNALWQSRDRGKSWHMLIPDPALLKRMYWVTDDGECHFETDDPFVKNSWRRIQAISVAPDNNKRILIAWSGNPAQIIESQDFGKSWFATGEIECEKVLSIIPQKPDHEIIISNKGIHQRNGITWTYNSGPENLSIRAVDASITADKTIVYVTTPVTWENGTMSGGIYVSHDLGQSWKNCTDGLKVDGADFQPEEEWRYTQQFKAIALDPTDPSRCYAGFRGLRDSAGKAFSGIALTEDIGTTWRFVHKESDTKNPAMATGYIADRAPDSYPNVWFDDPYSLDVSSDGNVCAVSDLFRVYKTPDRGQTWQQLYTRNKGDNLWQSTGIDVTNCYGVHWDPFDENHMYISYTDMGLFQSWDKGKSWQPASTGMPNTWRNTSYWIELDPLVEGLLWSASSAAHDLPRPRMFRRRAISTFDGGVCTSVDGGKTWEVTSEGLPSMAVTHILLDKQSAAGKRRLYISGFGHGVYTSSDNGQTWEKTSDGIEGDEPLCWRLSMDSRGILYAVIARRSEKGEIGDERDGALYRSNDQARTWEKMDLPEDTNGPMELTIDPENPERLYLAMWGRFRGKGDIGGGIFISENCGKTWVNVFDKDQHIYSVTVDPYNPNRLFAAGFESSIYRSLDRGETWKRIPGFNFTAAHRVFVDPQDHSKIYVTTFGGSLWHGPAAGGPLPNRDIATPIKALQAK